MKKLISKGLILGVFIAIFLIFRSYDLGTYLTFDSLKQNQESLKESYTHSPLIFIGAYMGVYILSTALSLPGATILTLAGGALFGFPLGLLLVSFASTLGATCAFLVARFILRDSIQSKFKDKLKTINKGIEREGAFYLFTMRLIPVFPFFVVNLVMALTPIKTITFYWVSQLGMLAGTMVYVNAGTQLASLESPAGILSPRLLGSFILLGLFPLIAKKLLGVIQARRVYRGYKKPKRFDYNMVAIGAGAAGLVSAYIATTVKARVALIEKNKMGGDCLNTGCVPSKALIRTAHFFALARRASEFGLKKAQIEFDFAEVMERVQRVIRKVEPHDSVERYTELGVECISGHARLLSPWEIEIDGPNGKQTLTARTIILATGASPVLPPIPGLAETNPLTSESVWELRSLPKRLLVLGGGPIGSELAQCFQRLGSQVTLVEKGKRILSQEDPEVSELVQRQFTKEGMQVLCEHEGVEFQTRGSQKIVRLQAPQGIKEIEFDEVLVALGRRANTQGFGLDRLGIRTTEAGTLEHDERMRTRFPNIYVCGDCAGPFQFTHTAAHQAWFAAVNALFSPFKTFQSDYRVIPWATYTDPEVARVGLNESQAKEQDIDFEVTTYGIDDLDRAIADEEDQGFVKVITAKGSDRILGATLCGHHAADAIVEFIAAMKHGFGLNAILGTIHIYPTMSEANKYLAGNWKKARKPEKLLAILEKFHRWRRG